MSDIDLVSIARIGIDAEAFAKSDIGKFLIEKAQSEIEAEMAALVEADPADVKLGMDIRNRRLRLTACRRSAPPARPRRLAP